MAVFPFISVGVCYGSSTCDVESFNPACLDTPACEGTANLFGGLGVADFGVGDTCVSLF